MQTKLEVVDKKMRWKKDGKSLNFYPKNNNTQTVVECR